VLNVGDRSQFSHREPFLTRLDRGLFRAATLDEVEHWRALQLQHLPVSDGHSPAVEDSPQELGTATRAKIELTSTAPMKEASAGSEDWHTEANVQASVVTALAADGWRILSVANTATREHGIDVIASRDGQTLGIEVKGYPSRGYADPARAGEIKRTQPSTQAAHWYSQAILAAMRLRGKEPTWRSVVALPNFPRYRDLHSETAGSLAAAQIEVWWVDQNGMEDRP
jgi:Holliday junction resolvase-like predicted endonuclease